jgi:hypothetical protein
MLKLSISQIRKISGMRFVNVVKIKHSPILGYRHVFIHTSKKNLINCMRNAAVTSLSVLHYTNNIIYIKF